MARENHQDPNTIYGAYRFYGNGCFNWFALDRNIQTLDREMFDPSFTGWRGIIYKKDDKIKGDLITQVSGMGAVGTITNTFEFNGDTLFIYSKNRLKHIFIKRKIPKELLDFKAEW